MKNFVVTSLTVVLTALIFNFAFAFDDSDFIPSANYNPETALFCAKVSSKIYSDSYDEIDDYLSGFAFSNMTLHDISQGTNDTQFLVAEKSIYIDGRVGTVILLAFRGTEINVTDPAATVKDVLTDFDVSKRDFPNGSGKVHSGFYNAMDSAKEMENSITVFDYANSRSTSLMNIIQNASNSDVYFLITGHSLGGAISTLYAADLINRGVPKSRFFIYTYGAPAVGDDDFVAAYDGSIFYHRVRSQYDPIPFSAYLDTLIKTGSSWLDIGSSLYLSKLTVVKNLWNSAWEDYPYKHIGYMRVFNSYGWDITENYHNMSIFRAGFLVFGIGEHGREEYITKLENYAALNSIMSYPTPPLPLLHSPINGETGINPNEVSFSWIQPASVGCGQVSYNLEVHKDGTTIYKADEDGNLIEAESTSLIDRLEANTTYSWAVFPRSEYGIWNTENVPWNTFTTGSGIEKPNPPKNPYPANNAYGLPTDINLSWENGGGAQEYAVLFGTDPSPDLSEYKGEQTSTSYSPGTLLPDTTYFWQILAGNEEGESMGEIWQFKTESYLSPPAPKATAPSPTNFSSNQPIDGRLTWSNSGNPEKYKVYLGINPNLNSGDYQQDTTSTSYTPNSLVYDQVFYWRIDSVNADGDVTTGDTWQFSTSNAPNPVDYLRVYDFWKIADPIYADPNSNAQNPNFDAQYKLRNDGSENITIERLSLTIHSDTDTFLWDLSLPNSSQPRFYDNITLAPSQSIHFDFSTCYFQNPGNYKLIAKAKINTEWNHLATLNVNILESHSQNLPPEKALSSNPRNGTDNVSLTPVLSWSNGGGADSFDIYFGKDSSPDSTEYVKNTSSTNYNSGTLQPDTIYYWKINSKNLNGVTNGDVWSFRTMPSPDGPTGDLSVTYNRDEDQFILNYSVNDNSDALTIYYAYEYNGPWTQIFDRINIVSIRSGNQPVKIPDSLNRTIMYFYLEARNSSDSYNTSVISKSYTPMEPYQEKRTEPPSSPSLYPLAYATTKNQVTLSWKKVIDSKYNDNVQYYEVEYSDNSSFNNAVRMNIGNPATGTNIYESIRHTITGLQDDTTYYFRVRATNYLATSSWSNRESIRIEMEDLPYFDTSYQRPEHEENGVNKTPVLRWRAYDPDGDDLDYYVTVGESPDQLYSQRSFRHPEHKGDNSFDFSEEYHEPLKPNTTYYWQIWVREDGHYSDYYGGEYIKSPVWNFTTVGTGSDPTITSVVQIGTVQPDSKVLFQVTVKNIGTEPAESQRISTSYIKNGTESPFLHGSATTGVELSPNAEIVVDVEVEFRDSTWERDGIVYDNVLVSGDSQIKFFFSMEDDQDINLNNNEIIADINYVDAGAPVIDYFYLDEHGRMYSSWDIEFWARMGKELTVILDAHDDIQVSRGIVDVRYDSTSENWINLYDGINDSDAFNFNLEGCKDNVTYGGGNFVKWLIPEDIQITDNAQVRIRLYDDQGNLEERYSDTFSIKSNYIEATIEPSNALCKVGNVLDFNLNCSSDNAIRSIHVDLKYGSDKCDVYHQFDDNGIEINNPYQWSIPNNNRYASQHCYLICQLEDVAGNGIEIQSGRFQIQENTELPAPFNESIILYNDEFGFPSEAMYKDEERNISFIKIDDSNVVHAVVEHKYRYFQDTASGYSEDLLEYSDKKYYITYNSATGDISSKIEICDKNYDIESFDLYNGTPYVLLKNYQYKQLYYSYKNGNSFASPISILNSTVPSINSVFLIDTHSEDELSKYDRYVFSNGFLWELDIFANNISRYSFVNGVIGPEESVNISNNAGSVESAYTKPVAFNNTIYFIDPIADELVVFNTTNNTANAYDLPFSPETGWAARYKNALAIDDGRLFVFGNGQVYEFLGSSFTNRGHISYSFEDQLYDVEWDDIQYIRAINTESGIVLIIRVSSYTPTWTDYHILEFDSSTYQFSRTVAETKPNATLESNSWPEAGIRTNQTSNFDELYLENNKLLTVFANSLSYSSSLNNYYAFVKMMDLSTGDIQSIGRLPIKSSYGLSLHRDNGNIYVLAENRETNQLESYNITLQNIDHEVNQFRTAKFQQHNGNLYATWEYGIPYDGTWNTTEGRIQSNVDKRNHSMMIAPTSGEVTQIFSRNMGPNTFYSNEHLSSYYDGGFICSLENDNFVANQIVYNASINNLTDYLYVNRGADFIGAFASYVSNANDLYFVNQDNSVELINVSSQSNYIASFDDEVMVVGEGTGDFENYILLTKHDLSSQEQSHVPLTLSNAWDYDSTGINSNMVVAIGWETYLTVADLSGDIVAPDISFTNTDGQLEDGSLITLSWTATDNLDELVKYEVYKTVDGVRTLLTTISDISITSYDYTLSESGATHMLFEVVAYDYSGNTQYDTVEYDILIPVVISDFQANKSNMQLGEKLIFTWSAENADFNTQYTVYRNKVGTTNWVEYFTVTGIDSLVMDVDGFVGEFQFKIAVGDDEMMLAHTVNVQGELLIFDYDLFSPMEVSYYVGERVANLHWGLETALSGDPLYEVRMRFEGESDFTVVESTFETSFQYVLPEDTAFFEWKISCEYQGMSYESSHFQIYFIPLQSPDVSNISILNNDGNNPVVNLEFMPISGITEYLIERRSSLGEFQVIATIEGNTYNDSDVLYGERYEYVVVSKIGELIGEAGASRTIDIEIEEIQSISITNLNYQIIPSNEILVSYLPTPNNCYERYEILIGRDESAMQMYATTTNRDHMINGLQYNATYYVHIYGLGSAGERTTTVPAKLCFTTGHLPLPTSPSNLSATQINSEQIQLTWIDNSGNELGFEVQRKSGDQEYSRLTLTSESNSFDENLISGNTYYYRVRAYNASGISEFSNEASLSVVGPVDSDSDGLSDDLENLICTDVNDADTDDDGILDGDEDSNHDGVKDPGETNPCDIDTDNDGIQDGTEISLTLSNLGADTDQSVFVADTDPTTQTNPLIADTDDDGYSDGKEDLNANGKVDIGESDPNDSSSMPHQESIKGMPWLFLLLE